MKYYNKATIIGNIGLAPVMKYSPDGDPFVRFSISTIEKILDKKTGEMVEVREWHKISASNLIAEACATFLKDGCRIMVQGKMHTRKFFDKNNVQKVKTYIQADEMHILDYLPDDPYFEYKKRMELTADKESEDV